jgi:hypothetical protein
MEGYACRGNGLLVFGACCAALRAVTPQEVLQAEVQRGNMAGPDLNTRFAA